MYLIKGFFQLSQDRKSLLIRSVVLTLSIRIFLYVLPFSRIHSIFNRIGKVHITQDKPKQIRDIIWSVKVAANHIHGATCLVQAITAQILMTHYKHNSTLRIGVNKSDKFKAHAWIEMDNKIILGESPVDFVPIFDLEPKFN